MFPTILHPCLVASFINLFATLDYFLTLHVRRRFLVVLSLGLCRRCEISSEIGSCMDAEVALGGYPIDCRWCRKRGLHPKELSSVPRVSLVDLWICQISGKDLCWGWSSLSRCGRCFAFQALTGSGTREGYSPLSRLPRQNFAWITPCRAGRISRGSRPVEPCVD